MNKKQTINQIDIYMVGEDELHKYDWGYIWEWFTNKGLLKPELIVYNYEYGGYEGSGILIVLAGDKWYINNLGHCSCYGPTEDFNPRSFDSLADISGSSSNGYSGQQSIVMKKLCELGYKV